MGVLSSRLLWRSAGRAPAEPGAVREEEEAAEAVVVPEGEEEEEGEEAEPTTSQGSWKRKIGPGSPLEKAHSRKRNQGRAGRVSEALFTTGEGSDVQICALGKKWDLHKVYLCQSGYFASMFSGAWRETTMTTIELQIPDENIDRDALQEAFRSLYCDVDRIPPSRVIAILATASMLQLDKLIEQCEKVMTETIATQTVCGYYYSADSYGLQSVKTTCLQWLLDNLVIQSNEELLPDISRDLMKELISSSKLLVIEVEMDVYTTLKKWMFLQLQPEWRGPSTTLLSDADVWFARYKMEVEDSPFLETEQGRAFVPVFRQLRFASIIWDLPSVLVIERDSLIPAAWLAPVYKEQWLTLLRAEQSRALGPVSADGSDPEGSSMRCGRILHRDEQCSWQWAGFNFGWDLVVSYINRRIIFRRSALNMPGGLGVSFLRLRKVAFRLRLLSLDRAGRAIFRKDTAYQMLSLRKDQELEVVNLEDQDVIFPMYVACNFLYVPAEAHCQE